MTPKVYEGELGYIQLLKDILSKGVDTPDRTSVGQCRKLFNCILYFDLKDSHPLPTIRPIPLKWAFNELWFFMSGETNTKVLETEGITLWKGNTSREFLDKRGLEHLPEGEMGNAYGYQWRSFGGQGKDQLKDTVDLLLNDPYSRRILTTFWNPADSEHMALLPCFYEHKFNVEKGSRGKKDILHLVVKARSCDVPFGLPFNYTQYGFYAKAMAELVNMEEGSLTVLIDDAHIYENQIKWVNELVTRSPVVQPTHKVEILKSLKTLEDLVTLKFEELLITGYSVNRVSFKTAKPSMAV